LKRQRIDTLLVERGVVESKHEARALIMEGRIMVGGKAVTKSGTLVNEEQEINLRQKPPFVSRGGYKLAHALDEFGIDVTSRVIADVGASTGGFTDCLLQRGAKRVYAIDVGYGQLDYRLRVNSQVVVMDRINARYPIPVPEKIDLITLDLSFISVQKVIPSVAKLLKKEGFLLTLLKPQFEAEKGQVGKGGVIKDPLLHAQILGHFLSWAIGQSLRVRGLTTSPILGAAGNREFFVLLQPRVEE
jgi:23S rRNA (cytidine1920-2'-O)/16S rRNA (cytidine1409-2'-O)-methyltransferase